MAMEVGPDIGTYSPAGPPGGAERPLSQILADEINIKSMLVGVGMGNESVDTAAMVKAIAKAAAAPGSTIRMPGSATPYKFRVEQGTFGFRLPSNTTLRGDGPSTIVTWNDADATIAVGRWLFGPEDSLLNPRKKNITFRDFTVRGTGEQNGYASAYPFLVTLVDNLLFENIFSEHSRVFAIAARYCTDVQVLNCRTAYSRSDGINMSYIPNVTVSNCVVSHADDDAIAVQSALGEPWGTRRNIIINNCRIFDANGMRVGGARNATISGNQLDTVRAFGISIEDMAPQVDQNGNVVVDANGQPVQQGELIPPQAVAVVGNTITNVLKRIRIDGRDSGHAAINITGFSARPGTAGAIPGEPSSAGVIKDPIFEFNANDGFLNVPTPGSVAVLVANNVIARTLPPTNGKDPRFNKWTDLGQGPIWTQSGPKDPALPEDDMRPTGVLIFGGVTRDVLITGNIIRGTSSPVSVAQGVRADVVVRGNLMTDYTNAGLLMNSTGKNRVSFDNNSLDADPYLLSANRAAAGSWASSPEFPCAVFLFQPSNVLMRGNTFRNMAKITNAWGNPGLFFAENYAEGDIATFGSYSASNKGIGTVPVNSAQIRYIRVGSDPTNANFANVLAMPAYP